LLTNGSERDMYIKVYRGIILYSTSSIWIDVLDSEEAFALNVTVTVAYLW